MEYTERRKWIEETDLYSLLKWLDEWVPAAFGPMWLADYRQLELLASHVTPRLVRELRERDEKAFGFYMGITGVEAGRIPGD